jgi:ribosomal protein S18 acetylase RimI-like enzyme
MADFSIRLYKPEDREILYRIAADTAFFGEPVDALLEDRRLFCDAFYRYYVDFEPEHIWVACAGAKVVGFLAGCLNTKARNRIMALRLLPVTVWGILDGKYRFGSRTRRYALELAQEALSGNVPRADLRIFPAHLHVNIAAAWQGQGLGRSLLTTYLSFLRCAGLPGVHLETTSRNVVACRLYESLGFHLLDERLSSLWTHFIGEPVFNRCYALNISAPVGLQTI